MKNREIVLEAFHVVGKKAFVAVDNGENFTTIPQLWENMSAAEMEKLAGLSNREPKGLLGLCANMQEKGFDYWIAAATTKECPKEFEKLEIPKANWLVFELTGAIPEAMQDGFEKIFMEYLPKSGFEHTSAPNMEWYSNGDMRSKDYKSEVWVPVVKK